MTRHLVFCVIYFLAAANSHAGSATWEACKQAIHGSSLGDALCTQLTIVKGQPGHLNILKIPSYSDKKSAPIVIITGGPGTAAVSLAAHYRYWFYKAQKEHDLIFIDQRGTGKSVPFDCEIDDSPDFYQDPIALLKAHHQKIIACTTRYQETFSLAEISTRQAAEDIEHARRTLGYEHLLLWGNSYGTRVALAYQQLFPHQVKALVLDGVAPIDIALPSHAQTDAEQALIKLFQFCDQTDICPEKFKPLQSHWQNILAALESSQNNSHNPITVTLTDPQTQKPQEIKLTPAIVANWVRFILYNRELSALLPLAIYQASQGNFMPLSNIAKVASDSTSTEVSAAMHAVILCREDFHRRENKLGEANTLLPFGALTDLTPVCEQINTLVPASPWPITDTTTGAPTLLLSGEFDPVTPHRWAEAAMTSLKHPTHLIINGGHHGVTPFGCVTDLVNQFFIDQTPLSQDAIDKCTSTLKPAAPFVDLAGPALPARETHD